jgi:DNA-binding transcriptional MerR regulator
MAGARGTRTSSTAESESASAKRYYRIGEVAKLTGVRPHVLRYWESEFRWMAPAKSRSKQRLYRQRDIDVVLLIKRLLWEEKFTIKGARKKLQELGISRALDAPQLDLALDGDPRAALRRIREALVEIRAALA